MRRPAQIKAIERILDANINRAKEGLRVCEEITRFILEDKLLTASFKKTRHAILGITRKFLSPSSLLAARESEKDVGREIKEAAELKRKSCQDIFFANIQRIKESIRVLEEFSKLINPSIALECKRIRYGIYALEKKVTKKLSRLRNNR